MRELAAAAAAAAGLAGRVMAVGAKKGEGGG